MLILKGPQAHTHFRIESLLTQINQIVPQVKTVFAEFVYFAILDSNITTEEQAILSCLLQYEPCENSSAFEIPPGFDSSMRSCIVVVPKPDPPSFWSNQATRIAHCCGLEKIQRVERGIVYSIEANEKLTWGDEQAIAKLLHNPDIEMLFYHLSDLRPNNIAVASEVKQSSENYEPNYILQGFCLSSVEDLLETPLQNAHFHNRVGQPIIGGYLSFENPARTYVPEEIDLEDALFRVLGFPAIADKSFLISLCDRSLTGLVVRDPMVGAWQTPVADCAVIAQDYDTYQGRAMAVGARPSLAIINPAAARNMARGEAITNLAAAYIGSFSAIEWSENNPMTCPSTDSKNRKNLIDFAWNATAPMTDVRRVLSPLLSLDAGETVLIFIDLSGGFQRLGGSALFEVFNQTSDKIPDSEDSALLESFFSVVQQLQLEGKLLAYHDRSEGGLFVSLCEMAFASHVGLDLDISELGRDPKAILFNEELGAVIQIRTEDTETVLAELEAGGISRNYILGMPNFSDRISIVFYEQMLCDYPRVILQKAWSSTSFQLQVQRDNPRCAKKLYESIQYTEDPGLNGVLSFDLVEDWGAPFISIEAHARPKVAILREQGTTGYREMAAAFEKAHFECLDVHMNDLAAGKYVLKDFQGIAVCSGFSFGDVLGAGQGWAKRILFKPILKDQFEDFFHRANTFSLGVANGCQMLSALKSLIPGANLFPNFIENYSEQFESRLCIVEIQETASIFLAGMTGSQLLVPVAHQEGRVAFDTEKNQEDCLTQGLVAMRYVDNWGRKTTMYPANPSGSPLGITGLSTPDGRVLIMMPQPERAFRTVQYAWHPKTWGDAAPWIQLFRNARRWIG